MYLRNQLKYDNGTFRYVYPKNTLKILGIFFRGVIHPIKKFPKK